MIRPLLTLATRRLEDVPRREQWPQHHEGGRAALKDALLHHSLKAVIAADAEHGHLRLVDDAGRPLEGWFANVSHTPGLAVAVLATSPVGVDVERVSRDPSRAIERFLNERDRERIVRFRHPDVTAELLLWTGKEAFSKAVGLGMAVGMIHVDIDLLAPAPYPVRCPRLGPFPLDRPRIHWEIQGDHLISICAGEAELARGIARLSEQNGPASRLR